ncbi:hypothetical protein GCM10008171_21220 [Methylopila jiangsuensis]|uniref:Uncharacterized protein n=1 Tax=Methylopila jiangsuensis TaxID=586230 RepID=A0A9W6JJW3_9HYPH|nr:DUF6111 family protein [Methylopila jiangsuensis]MDR6286786.1 hypothetical protein [Methylopila jiangsuensis]GLK76868.1 hypothetical protein GCM10008171_21220 [Methylopila jiangsuensis]
MTRILLQALLFLSPFIAYALWLRLTARGWRAPERWLGAPLVWLCVAGVALTVASLFALAFTSGGSTRAIYVPAHMENGVFVPGRITEPGAK